MAAALAPATPKLAGVDAAALAPNEAGVLEGPNPEGAGVDAAPSGKGVFTAIPKEAGAAVLVVALAELLAVVLGSCKLPKPADDAGLTPKAGPGVPAKQPVDTVMWQRVMLMIMLILMVMVRMRHV